MTEIELLGTFFKTVGHFYPKFIKWLGKISDPRNPNLIIYRLELLLLLGIFLFLFKIESRRNIHFKLATEEFKENLLKWLKLEGVSQEEISRVAHGDTVEYAMERVSPYELARLRSEMIQRLIRMRTLEKFRLFNKYYMIALDSTWEFKFRGKHCDSCLRRKVGEDKEGKPIYVYYHAVLEAKLVTDNGFAFSVATEFIENIEIDENENFEKQKQDCEMKAFCRLAPKIKSIFPQLNICLLLDGLYAAKPVFDICENYGWKYIVTFKEGSMPAVYQEFETLKRLAPEDSVCGRGADGNIQEYRWVNQIDYEEHNLNVLECKENREGRKIHFVWLTNFAIGASKNYKEIAKGGRCRWKIENQGFNTQKNGGYELEHPYSLNNTALKNYYFLIQIAHIINQLLEKGSLLKDKLLKVFGSIKNFSAALCQAFTSHIFHFNPDFLNGRIQIRFDST